MWPSEQNFANLLTRQKREWLYPVPTFKLHTSTYRPDFFLPKENLYIEVTASRTAYTKNLKKYKLFKKLYPHFNFVIVDINNNPYPYSKDFQGERIADSHSIRIDSNIYRKLVKLSKKTKWSIKDLIERALENYFMLKKMSSYSEK